MDFTINDSDDDKSIHDYEEEKDNKDYSVELYFAGFIFWLSGVINKCYFCCKTIYEENECIRETVDTTNYLTEYACKRCSYKKEEPMESVWISTNEIDKQSNILNDKYYIYENFTISQYYDFFFDYKLKNNDLVIIKGTYMDHHFKKEHFYICLKYLNLLAFYQNPNHFNRSNKLIERNEYSFTTFPDESINEVSEINQNVKNFIRENAKDEYIENSVESDDNFLEHQPLFITRINYNVLKNIHNKNYKPNYSNVSFLSVTYFHKNDVPVVLNVNKEWLVVGNEILGSTHVLRLLEYQSEPFSFSMDYVLDIIDSNINFLKLNSHQILKIDSENYFVKTLEHNVVYTQI